MVHHLGAGFSKETFYWLLQHKGRSQHMHTNVESYPSHYRSLFGTFAGSLSQFFVVRPLGPSYPSRRFLFHTLLILILCTLDAGGSSNRLQRSMVSYLSLSQAPELNHRSAGTSENEIPSACCEEDGTPPSLQLFICGFAHQLPSLGGSVGGPGGARCGHAAMRGPQQHRPSTRKRKTGSWLPEPGRLQFLRPRRFMAFREMGWV